MNRRGHSGAAEPLQIEEELSMDSVSIIKRREIEPLLLKARQVVRTYEGAVGCEVSVLDHRNRPVEDPALPRSGVPQSGAPWSRVPRGGALCGLCRQYRSAPQGTGDSLCGRPHEEGLSEARHRGGAYIYMCELGLVFWISPIYAGGRYAGALLSGGVLAAEGPSPVEKIRTLSGGQISGETAEECLRELPRKSHEEVTALSRMLRLCADRISPSSSGLEESGEWLKPIAPQEAGARNRSTRGALLGPSPQSAAPEEPVYPLDKERMLLAALRRGDNDTGRKILKELLDTVLVSNPGNFEFIRLRAIELVVLLSRAAAENSNGEEGHKILEQNNRWLKRIQESGSREELTGNLHLIIERIAARIFSFTGVRHASALRKAERYIWENYTRKISLQEIAGVSGLSAPYFSTVFKEEMGENFSAYLNRLRVQKAASMMMETGLPLNEIAAASGFEDQSWFSKIFKCYTGMSPGKYRGKGSDAAEISAKFPEKDGVNQCEG